MNRWDDLLIAAVLLRMFHALDHVDVTILLLDLFQGQILSRIEKSYLIFYWTFYS